MTVTRCASIIVAALCATTILAGCGGSDGEPVVTPTSETPSAAATDADGFTPEQREVIDAMQAYDAAFFGRGATPVKTAVADLSTDKLLSLVVPAAAQILDDGKLQYLGATKLIPTTVTIDGDKATFSGCRDSTNLIIVPAGETTGGKDSRLVESSQLDYGLVREGGKWLIDDPKGKPVSAC